MQDIFNGMPASELGDTGWLKPWSSPNGGSCLEAKKLPARPGRPPAIHRPRRPGSHPATRGNPRVRRRRQERPRRRPAQLGTALPPARAAGLLTSTRQATNFMKGLIWQAT